MKPTSAYYLVILSLTTVVCVCYANEQPKLSCDNVRCGFGSVCQLKNGKPICKCPSLICAAIYEPVCATNGKTYPNECTLKTATCKSNGSITKDRDGECKSDQASTPQSGSDPNPNPSVNPVPSPDPYPTDASNQPTGSANDTDYPEEQNKHNNENNNPPTHDLDKQETGESCKTSPVEQPNCERPCTRIYKPVCGSDGLTYDNICSLEIANCKSTVGIVKVDDGQCRTRPVPDSSPSDNLSQKCRFVCARARLPPCSPQQLDLGDTGSCISPHLFRLGVQCGCRPKTTTTNLPIRECNQFCPQVFMPVCGTDGRTYSNLCYLNIASCKSPIPIHKLRNGKCTSLGRSKYRSIQSEPLSSDY